jgi:hypothetical protein
MNRANTITATMVSRARNRLALASIWELEGGGGGGGGLPPVLNKKTRETSKHILFNCPNFLLSKYINCSQKAGSGVLRSSILHFFKDY